MSMSSSGLFSMWFIGGVQPCFSVHVSIFFFMVYLLPCVSASAESLEPQFHVLLKQRYGLVYAA